MAELFPGFERRRIATSGAEINCVIGGSGPPLLLLHGYPQTHAMWHRVAPRLAERFRVVCSDLRGYGDSAKPEGGAGHVDYSKRVMALDQVEVMRTLGFSRFRVAGHDRGARVTHRLCLDHPQAVECAAVLDISPTRIMYGGTNQAFATAYYHWFFLIQPFDLPERLIGADPIYYLRKKIGGWSGGIELFDPRALAEYERCFRDPATIHASCEDYRAAATIDLEHERRTRTARSNAHCSCSGAPRASCTGCSTRSPTGTASRASDGQAYVSGHFLAEEAPEQTLAELLAFF